MSDNTFDKVERSDAPLYGPRRLILCGFPAAAQPKFAYVLETAGLSGTAVVWVSENRADTPISDLLELADGTGVGEDSGLARAVVVSGITEGQLHRLMTVCRESGMRHALWAVLTPENEAWTVRNLLSELAAEREALGKL